MKKIILNLIVIFMLIFASVIGITGCNNYNSNEKTKINDENLIQVKDSISNNNDILVVYYSAQNHTKGVSERIAKKLNADIFEIVPEKIYTSEDLNWSNDNSRVSKEHNDETLRDIKLNNTKVENWEKYNIVLIGYPIWWGIAAWPVDNFIKSNDFVNKKVIPFCTSVSSGIGQSGKLLEQKTNSGNWIEGYRFNEQPDDEDINKFINTFK